MDLLYKWLISLTTPESAAPDVIINEDNFVKDLTLTVLDKVADEAANQDDNKDNDVYNTNLNFKLAFIPGANDDLLVQINYVDYDGVSRSLTRRLAGANSAEQDYITILPDENGNYVIPNIKLSENDNFNFDLRLEGTQYLDRGAYLYTCVDENHQDFVGIAEGKRGVDVSIGVSVTFNVDENDKTIVERKWHDEGDPQNTPPTTPNTPSDDPTNPTGGDRQPEFGNYTPTLLSGDEEIEEEEVPLNEEPEVEEEDYEEDDEIEILDEEVPLAEVPETGDVSDVMMLLVIFSVIGLIAINLPAKKRFNV